VGAVAKGLVFGLFAQAKPSFAGLLCGEQDRTVIAAFVRTIAIRLRFRASAGAPRVFFSRFQDHFDGLSVGDYRFAHGLILLFPISKGKSSGSNLRGLISRPAIVYLRQCVIWGR